MPKKKKFIKVCIWTQTFVKKTLFLRLKHRVLFLTRFLNLKRQLKTTFEPVIRKPVFLTKERYQKHHSNAFNIMDSNELFWNVFKYVFQVKNEIFLTLIPPPGVRADHRSNIMLLLPQTRDIKNVLVAAKKVLHYRAAWW